MKYVIDIDVGTSGTKCALYSEAGLFVSSHTEDYDMHQPKPGWAEQNPEDW
jgi:xylulokinase